MGREWDRLWCIVVCAFLVIFIPSISALEEGDFALVTQADIGAGYPAIWNPIDNDNVLLPGSFITYRTYPNTDCNMLRKFDAFGNIGFTEIVGTTSGDNCEGIFNDNPMIFHYPNPVNVYSLMYFYLYTDSGFSEMAYTQFINPIDGTRQTNAMQTFISAAKKQKQPSVVIYEYPAGNDQFLYAFVGEKPSQPNTVVLTRRSSTSYNVLYSSNAESYKIQFINSEYNNNPNLWLLVSVFGGADPGTKLLRIDPDTTGNPSIELGPISLDPAGRSFEHTIPDNQGGLIYAYDNNKVSRVLSDGTTRFDVDPVGACQTETRLVAGENSIIVFCIETGELKAYKLDYDGNEVEGPFAVGTKNANADDLYHAIRYENDKALVAWSDDTEKIRVASIDASGPLTKEFEEVMSDPTEPAIKIRPKVMLEPNAPRGWLVIWQDERSGQREIYSRLQNPPPVVELNQPTDLDLLTCTDNIQMSYTATDDSGNNMDCEVFFEDSGADVSAHGPVTVPSGGTMNINQDLTAVPNYPKLNNVWTRTFADAPIEGAVYTGDGYVVAGKKNSDDTILIKLRPDSALSWARYYSVMNGLGQVTGLQTADNGDLLLSTKATSSIGKFNRFDFEGIRDSGFGLWLKSVYETIEHSSGNLFAVAEELGDSLIRKTQADSTLINEQNYLGEKFRDIIEKSNGNLIVAGTQLAEEIDPDTLLPVWQVALTSYAEKVIETSDGGLLFVGVEDSSGDYAIMERTDLNGAPDWIWTSEIYSEVFANGIIEVDQGYIMLCTVRINPTDKYDFALFFIDKNGNLILKQEYDYNGNDNYGNDIIRTEGNSFVVAGYDRYYDGLVAHKDARIMKVNIDNSCYNWYVTCEDGDGSTGVSETWEFCMDCLCGNGVVDNGEACDGRSWGSMTGCEDFDEFTGGILDCFNDGPNKCLFNTGSCEPTIAVPVCGDGNIESGETCDFDPATGAIIWDTNVNECGWFDDWTAGTLGCFPEGHEDECHVDTTLCTKGEEVFCDVYTQAVDITAQSIGVAGQTGWFMKEYSNLDYVTVVKGPEKAHLMEGSPSKFIVGLENDWRYYEDDSQEFSVNEKILAADINPSTWIAVGGIDGWKIYDTIGAIRAQGNLETYDIEFTEPWEILVGGPSGWEEWDVLTPQLLASGPEITYSIDSWKQEDPPASNYLIARGGPDGWYGYYKNSGGVQWFCSGPESVNTLAVGAYILISTDTGVYWVTPGACTLNLVSPDSANQLSGLGGDDLYDVTRIGALADDNQFATFNDIGTISSHENQRAVTTSAFSGFPGGNYHLAIGAGEWGWRLFSYSTIGLYENYRTGLEPIGECIKSAGLCGNHVVDPGEECEVHTILGDDWGRIEGCWDFGTFQPGLGELKCHAPGTEHECFFDTRTCEALVIDPGGPGCGNGIIDPGETCDFENYDPGLAPGDETWTGEMWGPEVQGCAWFDSWTGGPLNCIPPGQPHQCHFNTLDCGEGINQIGMHCGDVYHYEFGNELDTIACRDDDHLVPIGLPFLCANPTDCLYGDEYLTVDSDYPHYQCYEDGEVRLNHGGSLIKCIGENIAGTPISKWCPIHFEWDESAGVGGECRITNDPDRCDLGTMYDVDLPDDTPWQSNCSENMTAWDIRSNYSTEYQCLRPKAASPDPPDMGPYPKHAACCKDFSVSNYDDTLNPYRHYGFFLIKDVTII